MRKIYQIAKGQIRMGVPGPEEKKYQIVRMLKSIPASSKVYGHITLHCDSGTLVV